MFVGPMFGSGPFSFSTTRKEKPKTNDSGLQVVARDNDSDRGAMPEIPNELGILSFRSQLALLNNVGASFVKNESESLLNAILENTKINSLQLNNIWAFSDNPDFVSKIITLANSTPEMTRVVKTNFIASFARIAEDSMGCRHLMSHGMIPILGEWLTNDSDGSLGPDIVAVFAAMAKHEAIRQRLISEDHISILFQFAKSTELTTGLKTNLICFFDRIAEDLSGCQKLISEGIASCLKDWLIVDDGSTLGPDIAMFFATIAKYPEGRAILISQHILDILMQVSLTLRYENKTLEFIQVRKAFARMAHYEGGAVALINAGFVEDLLDWTHLNHTPQERDAFIMAFTNIAKNLYNSINMNMIHPQKFELFINREHMEKLMDFMKSPQHTPQGLANMAKAFNDLICNHYSKLTIDLFTSQGLLFPLLEFANLPNHTPTSRCNTLLSLEAISQRMDEESSFNQPENLRQLMVFIQSSCGTREERFNVLGLIANLAKDERCAIAMIDNYNILVFLMNLSTLDIKPSHANYLSIIALAFKEISKTQAGQTAFINHGIEKLMVFANSPILSLAGKKHVLSALVHLSNHQDAISTFIESAVMKQLIKLFNSLQCCNFKTLSKIAMIIENIVKAQKLKSTPISQDLMLRLMDLYSIVANNDNQQSLDFAFRSRVLAHVLFVMRCIVEDLNKEDDYFIVQTVLKKLIPLIEQYQERHFDAHNAHDEKSLVSFALVIENITQYPWGIEFLIDQNFVPRLVGWPKRSAKISEAFLMMLRKLTNYNNGRVAVAHWIPKIIDGMKATNTLQSNEVVRHLTWILDDIVHHIESRSEFIREDGLRQFLQLLKLNAYTPDVRRELMRAIKNIVDHPFGCVFISKNLIHITRFFRFHCTPEEESHMLNFFLCKNKNEFEEGIKSL